MGKENLNLVREGPSMQNDSAGFRLNYAWRGKKIKTVFVLLSVLLVIFSYFYIDYIMAENINEALSGTTNYIKAIALAGGTLVALFLMLIAFYSASLMNEKILKSRALYEVGEESHRIVIENVADMISKHALDGTFTSLSSSCKRILGYEPEELIGTNPYDLIHPEDLELVRKAHFYIISSPDQADIAYRMCRKNGTYVRLESSYKVVRDPVSEEPMEILSVSSDVTRRIAEEDMFKQMVIFAEELLKTGSEQVTYHKILENVLHISKAKTATLTLLDDSTGKLNMAAIAEAKIYMDAAGGSVAKYADTGEVIVTKLIVNHQTIGVLTLMMPIGKKFENNYLVKIYTGQIEMFHTRIKVENELRKSEASLSNEKMLLETTLISVGDGVISTDTTGRIVFLNRAAETLTGWTQPDAKGKSIEEVFHAVDAITSEKIENVVEKVMRRKKTIEMSKQTNLISRDGIERPIEHSAAPIVQGNGDSIGVVLVFRDYSEKKSRQEEIIYLSYHDQLTGLHNRRSFDREVNRLDKMKSMPLGLVMLDVNGLKLTNDAFGHKAGDVFLAKVAEILKRECRQEDIAARIGGDEFVLLLPETDVRNVEIIIDRINKAIENEKMDNIILSISIGYAVKLDGSDDIDEVFKKAEDNMYRHKLYESSSMRSKTIDIIIKTLYEKNNREMLHSKRVSELCEALAMKLDFDKDAVSQMRLAGLMHDIGKIGIDEKILNKTKRLGNNEMDEMQRHSEIGYRILSSVNEFSEIADYVLEHHERWDGKGYPKGLKGEDITLQARIIAIADAFDAITSSRTYRIAVSEEEAILEIERCSGTQFDPILAKIFIDQILDKIHIGDTLNLADSI